MSGVIRMLDNEDSRDYYASILLELKVIIESLIVNHDNSWDFARLHSAVTKIFKCRCRFYDENGEADIWAFIQMLTWIQPSLANSPSFLGQNSNSLSHFPMKCDKANTWIHNSIKNGTLGKKLVWLLSDETTLLIYYEECAFLVLKEYREALLTCFQALDSCDLSILSKIDSHLYERRNPGNRRSDLNSNLGQVRNVENANCQAHSNKLNQKVNQTVRHNLISNWQSNASDPKFSSVNLPSSKSNALIANSNPEVNPVFNQPSKSNDQSNELNSEIISVIPHSSIYYAQPEESKPNFNPVITSSQKNYSQVSDSIPKIDPVYACTSGNYTRSVDSKPKIIPAVSHSSKIYSQTNESNQIINSASTSKNYASLDELDLKFNSVHARIPRINPGNFKRSDGYSTKNNTPNISATKNNSQSEASFYYIDEDSLGSTPKLQQLDFCDYLNSSRPRHKRNSQRRHTIATLREQIKSNKSSRKYRSESEMNKILSKSCASREEIFEFSDIGESISTPSDLSSSYSEKPSCFSFFYNIPRKACSGGDNLSDHSGGSQTLVPSKSERRSELAKKRSFIENDGTSVLPMSMGFFPKPLPGQSIASFLSSGVFSRSNAELDRENAHFYISEAIIATLEQVKWDHKRHLAEEMLEESDEEINELKNKIRQRRRRLKQEQNRSLFAIDENSDSTLATDQSVQSLTSSVYSTSDSISTEDECENSNLLTTRLSGLSVSQSSLFSDVSHNTVTTMDSCASWSAESVALSLIRRFNEKKFPPASDIEWLVSERDAPQMILPMPTTVPINSDESEAEYLRQGALLRGNAEWAPPRPQIIFTPHPRYNRRVVMEKQKYRCAGCGARIAEKYISRLRYCDYLGRYFCSGCHSQNLSLIPGRIIKSWDFNRYQVSNFAYQLLDEMSTDALFNITDLNPSLYKKVRRLNKVKILRTELNYLKDFIVACRFAEKLQDRLKDEETHLFNEIDKYSMQDLINVKTGKLEAHLAYYIKDFINHVNSCELCQARGFICEFCNDSKPIFPWYLLHVFRCAECGSCYHFKCYKKKKCCPKCVRLENRRNSANAVDLEEE